MTIYKLAYTLIMLMLLGFACSPCHPPTDANGRPLIVKSGTIDCDLVETTPVVFHNKVYRFEYVRKNYAGNHTGDAYFRFVDRQSGNPTTPFAKGFHMGSAFVYKDTVYVTGVDSLNGKRIYIFSSHDLNKWNQRLVFSRPDYGIFNTSLTRAENKFVLMFEISKPKEEAGIAFTARFATSPDLLKWEILSPEHNYVKDSYTAPHCLRYLDGYYYDFYLEVYKGFEARVVRSKDLINWEPSPLNPLLKASSEDRKIGNKNLTEEMRQKIITAEDCNNSDIDFCEFNGRLIINYSWGNQRGAEFLAEAYYNGTQAQFLRGWFPQ